MRCNVWLFTMTTPGIGDVEASTTLRHLWRDHPDVVREPHTLVLDELLSFVRVEPV